MAYRPTLGEGSFRFLVQSLAEGGRSDVLFKILNRTDPPGYGVMLRKYNLKTLSERWDKPGESLNHCMFGQVQEWFQGYLLGIRQADRSIGFEHLRIAPNPVGDLTQAEGYFDGPRGRIEVAWKRSPDSFSLEVTIPPETTADIVIPENSGPPTATPDLPRRAENATYVFTAGPGRYTVTCGTP
jgi:hypothetical protein